MIILTFSCCSKNVREMLGRNNMQPPSCLRCTVLQKERLSTQRPQRGYNKLTFIGSAKYLDTLKNTFIERSSKYTSLGSKKQPANARSERKQFTENTSVALQQTMLTHSHTKYPPVNWSIRAIYYWFDGINYDTATINLVSIPEWTKKRNGVHSYQKTKELNF